eukprot:1724981-Rhodomonas_salina.1
MSSVACSHPSRHLPDISPQHMILLDASNRGRSTATARARSDLFPLHAVQHSSDDESLASQACAASHHVSRSRHTLSTVAAFPTMSLGIAALKSSMQL